MKERRLSLTEREKAKERSRTHYCFFVFKKKIKFPSKRVFYTHKNLSQELFNFSNLCRENGEN